MIEEKSNFQSNRLKYNYEIMWKNFEFKKKVFCIGANKTGTTSLKKIFKEFKYNVAPQHEQERKLEDFSQLNDQKNISFIKKYDFFQDMPFSMGINYVKIDTLFPGSLYILTTRDSEKWYESLCKFHLNIYNKIGFNLQSIKEVKEKHVKEFPHIYKGYAHKEILFHWISEVKENKINYNWDLIYNKKHYINIFENRNKEIIKYFQRRANQLLVIDLSKQNNDNKKIQKFLNINSNYTEIPHLNKT